MSFVRRTYRLGIAFSFLILMGFGCKKPTSDTSFHNPLTGTTNLGDLITAPPPTPTEPTYVSHLHGPPGPDPEVLSMQQALHNFENTKTFHVIITFPINQGSAEGDVDVVRGQGFHGTLHLANNFISEIIFLDGQTYFRSGTSTWQNVTGSPEDITTDTLFQPILSLDDNSTSTFIRDAAHITQTTDDTTNQCKRYSFYQYNDDSQQQMFDVCIKDDLPLYIINENPSGNLEIQYQDFDQPITITKPDIKN